MEDNFMIWSEIGSAIFLCSGHPYRGVPIDRFGDRNIGISGVFGCLLIGKIVICDAIIYRPIYRSAGNLFTAYLMQYSLKLLLLRFLSKKNLKNLRNNVFIWEDNVNNNFIFPLPTSCCWCWPMLPTESTITFIFNYIFINWVHFNFYIIILINYYY